MKSLLAPTRSPGGLEHVDRAVRLFEEKWRQHGGVSLERYCKDCKVQEHGEPVEEFVLLGALVKADLRCRFERGQTPVAAEYIQRFPELYQDKGRILSLIYEEFCLREEHGESLDVDSFCGRYSAWKDSLASQLQYHRLFSQAAGLHPPSPHFPEAGDDFEEFHLVSLIGQGGSSRVFLANDLSLGGKRVVLKVSLDRGQEPKTQGVLDHPHIVPVNSVAFQPEKGLRGLSMPYRPGLPLDQIVRWIEPARRPCGARRLWDVLVEETVLDDQAATAQDRESLRRDGPKGDGWKGFPVRGTYAQGVAWIGLTVARALDYAHGKRTFHRDVKPGNVFLTLHHGPQLLDFNLADSPHSAHHAEAAMLGGTVPYMAPEQIEAFLNPDLWGKVGAQADIYSLGLLLRELLTGEPPHLPNEKLPPARALRDLLDHRACLGTDVRRFNPEIPHALEAIVEGCLKFALDDRYPDAHILAEDLERFLQRKPLHRAFNPARRERLANWFHRNHRWLVANAIYLTMIGAVLSQQIVQRLKPPVDQLPVFEDAVRDVDNGNYARAISVLTDLAKEYSDSPLPMLYLSFAMSYSDRLPVSGPHLICLKDLTLPRAESQLWAWAKNHPRVASHLLRFSSCLLKKTEPLVAQTKQAKDALGNHRANPKVEECKHRLFDMALHASQMALALDPSSEQAARQIATVEESRGNYQSAHQRLSDLIDAVLSQGYSVDSARLLSLFIQRDRVATRWAAFLLHSGSPANRAEALKIIREAVRDLDRCNSMLFVDVGENAIVGSIPNSIRFYFLRIQTEAILTLAEVERAHRLLALAGRDFEKAKRTFDRFTDFAIVSGLKIRDDVDLLLKQRLRDGLKSVSGNKGEIKQNAPSSRLETSPSHSASTV
jgi:serine/threonine protein kinase